MSTKRRGKIGLSRLFWVGCAAALAAGRAGAEADALRDGPQRWIESPYRQFGAPQALPAGRAILIDEADDPAVRSALIAALQRLDSDLFGRDGWRIPFDTKDPLRIYLARHAAEGIRQLSGEAGQGGRISRAAVLLDASNLTATQIAHEVSRTIVRATLNAYGASEDAFLSPAVVEALAVDPSEAFAEDEAWTLAAAPTLDFRGHPSTLGRFWVDEVVRELGGSSFFRQVWERASASGESPLPVAVRMLPEASAPRAETLLLRATTRLYASVEAEAGPSRLKRFDLEAGALDASPPEELSVRHRAFLPEDSQDALRVAWPEDAGAGAAIVRYRDAALPADVLFFGPGDVRRIPLSGVSRLDWLVVGSPGGGRAVRAPASVESARFDVFTGLDARASGLDRPRLTWRTASHEGLWGWAVFREELKPDGHVARTGPEIVPSSERSDEPFSYVFVDSNSTAGTFYRYTVWAVTDEALLARAFAVTLRAGE
jgi:hypothetical protein